MVSLLDEITAFMKTHSMSARQFGELALNDTKLVPDLQGGEGKRPRRLYPETEQRIRRFMVEYRASESRAA